jgi:DNA gyrase subunit A
MDGSLLERRRVPAIYGKIIRNDTKTGRSACRSTSGVKLLNLDTDDKAAADVVIPRCPQTQPENGRLLQQLNSVRFS